jgi:hypothetical protein
MTKATGMPSRSRTMKAKATRRTTSARRRPRCAPPATGGAGYRG